MDERPFMSSNL